MVINLHSVKREIRCETCGEGVQFSHKEVPPHGGPVFCSPICLRFFLRSIEQSNGKIPIRRTTTVSVSEEKDAYSHRLSMMFRSKFEVYVAEYLWAHGVKWIYEKIELNLPSGKIYVPDFYVPKSRCFLEVKGRWHFGAKGKFKEACQAVPEMVILVPYTMFKIFEREAKRLPEMLVWNS